MPTYDGNYLISSQGLALMKVANEEGRSRPGLPVFVKSLMTAADLSIDCSKGKVLLEFHGLAQAYTYGNLSKRLNDPGEVERART